MVSKRLRYNLKQLYLSYMKNNIMKNKVFALILSVVFMLTACGKYDSNATVYDGAYVLSDKATFLNFSSGTDGNQVPNLKILFENYDSMLNTFG